jgi:serine/threonine-protein kinase HipA
MTITPDGLDLRTVNDADIYLNDEVVASLNRLKRDEIGFSYTDPSLKPGESVRDRSVSWSLPITAGYPVIATGGPVPPFFAGLLPEGVRLGVVTSSTKTSTDDHLTLLLAIGADTIGNVRVLPADVDPPENSPMFVPERDSDFREVFERLTGSVEADPVGLSGVQPKVSAAMWSTPANTTMGPAILKLNPPTGYPRLVENEHFFMRMAMPANIPAATDPMDEQLRRTVIAWERVAMPGEQCVLWDLDNRVGVDRSRGLDLARVSEIQAAVAKLRPSARN